MLVFQPKYFNYLGSLIILITTMIIQLIERKGSFSDTAEP